MDNSKILGTAVAIKSQNIGVTDYGMVVKQEPYGNKDSTVKIAYIVGVHPLESDSHKAIVESVLHHQNSLRYVYYVYNIIVIKDAGDYEKGRMNGQLLANRYAVPDIKNQKFDLVVDFHSNKGHYAEKWFLFSPIKDRKTESIAFSIRDRIPGLKYYVPPPDKFTSSPPYVTIPLIKGGIPAVLYETYQKESYGINMQHADDFVLAVDETEI